MRPPPDVFAAVMATGIVSIAAADHGYRRLSVALAVIAVAALPVLVVACASSWRRSAPEFGDPDVLLRLFTYVAACAVLGARLAEYRTVLWILAGLSLQFWLTLTPLVVRRMWRIRWIGLRDRSHGAWELASVATSGLAILSADLDWLFGALLFWALALAAYVAMTALILWRAFHERFTPGGFEPDGWILMGALAIATLAGDRIHRIWPSDAAVAVTVLTWVLATLWIPVLAYFAIRRLSLPAAWGFRAVWWAMVFPLGMYSAATFAMAAETRWRGLHTVSLVFFWVALAAWVIVAAGGLLYLRSHHRVTGIDR
ncbi:tellurite resistance/C4-dicarboxylate transporter family protein [Mycolicibacterium aichiense]|uniref:C4-dicarboxylate ABC transporter n=1 Tax=Mycolicibacterium aichiense TaxID=1799 RepID=A0AAD1HJJ2_9MYCO|nr:tellurite resistance/C4-dicarboxylate transporter family protein [Mycolicibacterium aichiense]MCV7021294.1 tellurite resistance/C4-dicarboxylate transporter family protein [Mycolicibacterium aichiense]BBX05874.1 C4-dicarboxylate ABC transporter [Mycolicibacterium aichiense]STZ24785.1 tellurite resistance protein-like permease [Mycolicibacterium aichiense]